MDGSNVEHSDSDSGESWTLLEHTPVYADDAPELSDSPTKLDGYIAENIDKEEDTDGISIISDSDPESSTPCEFSYDKCLSDEENRPTAEQIPQYVSVNSPPPNNKDNHHESIRGEDDFLGDKNGKLRTYVHRRNRRLSTVLNIIVLGSVITAAGVAIGHMWGVRDDCSMHTTPSVNKILSNLYKLQEENAYLRNKLKELTLVNNIQMQQRKYDPEKLPSKHKCKKVFEESLSNKNVDKFTKCVDNDNQSPDKFIESYMLEPEYKKEVLNDIEKLKNIYKQNKSWLDEEVARRLKTEEQSIKTMKTKSNLNRVKGGNLKQSLETVNESAVDEKEENVTNPILEPELNVPDDINIKESSQNNKITYADSVKLNKDNEKIKKFYNRDGNEITESNIKKYILKKKPKKICDTDLENSISEDELGKDDRYIAQKRKQEKNKNDRKMSHKKQKRKNKYEQCEMKRCMKDYDDFSATSSQKDEDVSKNSDKNTVSQDFEQINYMDQFSETDDGQKVKSKRHLKEKSMEKNNKETSWYEKRAALRTEARKNLEKELFGETSQNTAGWYFRRMQRREQCRAKRDNSTYRKYPKRSMNFKMKH